MTKLALQFSEGKDGLSISNSNTIGSIGMEKTKLDSASKYT